LRVRFDPALRLNVCACETAYGHEGGDANRGHRSHCVVSRKVCREIRSCGQARPLSRQFPLFPVPPCCFPSVFHEADPSAHTEGVAVVVKAFMRTLTLMSVHREQAKTVKETMDKKFAPNWHCFIGQVRPRMSKLSVAHKCELCARARATQMGASACASAFNVSEVLVLGRALDSRWCANVAPSSISFSTETSLSSYSSFKWQHVSSCRMLKRICVACSTAFL
jgi:hypothetical protein